MGSIGLLDIVIGLLDLEDRIEESRNSVEQLPFGLVEVGPELGIHLYDPFLVPFKEIDISLDESNMHSTDPNAHT